MTNNSGLWRNFDCELRNICHRLSVLIHGCASVGESLTALVLTNSFCSANREHKILGACDLEGFLQGFENEKMFSDTP